MADSFWSTHIGTGTTATCDALAAAFKKHCAATGFSPQGGDNALVALARCIVGSGNSDNVTKAQFDAFAARFGPWEGAIEKAATCMLVDGTVVVPWFHGFASRKEASTALTGQAPGTYLVRNSSQAGAFVLVYVADGGVVKNVLLHNLGERGYALSKAAPPTACFDTPAAFIKAASGFSNPIASALHAYSRSHAFKSQSSGASPKPSAYGAFVDPDELAATDNNAGGAGGAAGASSGYGMFYDHMDAKQAPAGAAAPASAPSAYGAFVDPTDAAPGASAAATPGAAGAGNSAYGAFMGDEDVPSPSGHPAAGHATGSAAPSAYGAFMDDFDAAPAPAAAGGHAAAAAAGGGGAYGAFVDDTPVAAPAPAAASAHVTYGQFID